jgi:hypothetical protein
VTSGNPARSRIRRQLWKLVLFLTGPPCCRGEPKTHSYVCGNEDNMATRAGGSGTGCGVPVFVVGLLHLAAS